MEEQDVRNQGITIALHKGMNYSDQWILRERLRRACDPRRRLRTLAEFGNPCLRYVGLSGKNVLLGYLEIFIFCQADE